MNRIGLLIISTSKYEIFIEPLLRSVDKYFFKNEPVDIYLFVDKVYNVKHSERLNIVQILIKHYPFPYATLYRYKHFTTHKDLLKSEFLYYLDVDMRIVAPIGDEILPDKYSLVATIHPGFYKGGGSWENNEKSMAYMSKEDQKKYYAGGFQGGQRDIYLNACIKMSEWINIDQENGVMPIWQDESIWNKYLSGSIVKELSPSYCYPEARWARGMPFKKKIIALEKNHAEIRS